MGIYIYIYLINSMVLEVCSLTATQSMPTDSVQPLPLNYTRDPSISAQTPGRIQKVGPP